MVESQLYLDPLDTYAMSSLTMSIVTDQGYSRFEIFSTGSNTQRISCWSQYFGKVVKSDQGLDDLIPSWHVLRFEIDPEQMTVTYVIDGKQMGLYNFKEILPGYINDLSTFNFQIYFRTFNSSNLPVSYVDYVRIGAIEDDPNSK